MYAKMITCLLTLIAATSLSYADSVKVPSSKLEMRGWKLHLPMPCNWDTNLENVVVYAYYLPNDHSRHTEYQDDLDPTVKSWKEEDGKKFLTLEFDYDIKNEHLKGESLQRLEVDFQTTNRKCEGSSDPFGFMGDWMK